MIENFNVLTMVIYAPLLWFFLVPTVIVLLLHLFTLIPLWMLAVLWIIMVVAINGKKKNKITELREVTLSKVFK